MLTRLITAGDAVGTRNEIDEELVAGRGMEGGQIGGDPEKRERAHSCRDQEGEHLERVSA